jgi:hypothetical protein
MSTPIVGERFYIYACKAKETPCADLVGWPAGRDAPGADDRTGGAGEADRARVAPWRELLTGVIAPRIISHADQFQPGCL